MIEEYLEHELGHENNKEDANMVTDFMAVCMKIVNEQLTPAHVSTELFNEDVEVPKGRQCE